MIAHGIPGNAAGRPRPGPAPGDQQRLLKNMLGVLNRAEDPVAAQLELLPLRVEELAERLLVSHPGAGERSLGHDGILAWPVPLVRLTVSDPIRAEQESPVPPGPRWCLNNR